jgi:hypothetical protein
LRLQTSPGRLDRRKLALFVCVWSGDPVVPALFDPSAAVRMKERCYANQIIEALE